MPKLELSKLSSDKLIERKGGHLKRYLVTLSLLIILSLFLGYRDFIKKTEFSYTETYVFILIGLLAITIELIYKTRKINRELTSRDNN